MTWTRLLTMALSSYYYYYYYIIARRRQDLVLAGVIKVAAAGMVDKLAGDGCWSPLRLTSVSMKRAYVS